VQFSVLIHTFSIMVRNLSLT